MTYRLNLMYRLNTIFKSPQTVFTFNDIALILQNTDRRSLIATLYYHIKTKQIIRIKNGIYAKDIEYNRQELASKIYVPSYISFETVLAEEGINFQYSEEISLASYKNKTIIINNQTYRFIKIKDEILNNPIGISNSMNISKASKERAILDTLYSKGNTHFDNLDTVNWEKIFEILPIYNNKRMVKNINNIYAQYK
jgi:hypothetical protein